MIATLGYINKFLKETAWEGKLAEGALTSDSQLRRWKGLLNWQVGRGEQAEAGNHLCYIKWVLLQRVMANDTVVE
jgi:hypothetical protein